MYRLFYLLQIAISGIALLLLAIWIVSHIVKGYITTGMSLFISTSFLALFVWLFVSSIKEKYNKWRRN